MNKITKFTIVVLPSIVGIGIVWVGNKFIKNEKRLKDRELELKLQVNRGFD